MDADALEPAEVARRRDLLLVDIRPEGERRSELGFLPASVSAPLAGAREAQLARLAALRPAAGLVLFCTSGRRSAVARDALAGGCALPLFHLAGGQLAWAGAGLPVCLAAEATEHPGDVLAFRRYLISCFVAEATELALDQHRAEITPVEALEACFRSAGVSWDAPTIDGLYRVLDWTGVTTFRAGGELRTIAANLSAMHGMLAAMEREAR